jgi:hypothetical protein
MVSQEHTGIVQRGAGGTTHRGVIIHVQCDRLGVSPVNQIPCSPKMELSIHRYGVYVVLEYRRCWGIGKVYEKISKCYKYTISCGIFEVDVW